MAIEATGLHKRMALAVLKTVGTSPRRLMFRSVSEIPYYKENVKELTNFLSFMLIGWLLSMFLSNAASCAMMIPIARISIKKL